VSSKSAGRSSSSESIHHVLADETAHQAPPINYGRSNDEDQRLEELRRQLDREHRSHNEALKQITELENMIEIQRDAFRKHLAMQKQIDLATTGLVTSDSSIQRDGVSADSLQQMDSESPERPKASHRDGSRDAIESPSSSSEDSSSFDQLDVCFTMNLLLPRT
jgi:hypothetical protein